MTALSRPGPATLPTLGADGCILFDHGVLGFPRFREYRLSEGPGDALYWLTEAHDEGPSFILVDPFAYFEGFSLDLPPEQAQLIEAVEPGEVVVLSIAVPGTEAGEWTANLQGPVVINTRNLRAVQIVLGDRSLDLRRPFRPHLEQKRESCLAVGQ